ncbi:4-(cytidine 5'-diphospho)-2-C-methyl-D-erythritol kinase [Campylobacter corcagiensis]|uniref:4-(cytidine 5'-diphospho)-2-C-methyl-D-erythritol kinase n=1 Tax=Campylobacter corcagiensis TaxID=1448857 RepID=A0A7M1LE34_9BACT|nr:4-(cytidine 5'-diphospho)-2-C-methyl-D-erythritol kinase [Campylobacter corcagiensis]QKF65009.1 4-diphosphocytidyl-2-C-methylerythritol kinase [Campylobacter corcagiensis]QOQ86837.1 4-(cytidine 5'-diphospho)-2-C-methyl-D-erythritol kinase [Campylobacter corcagiensis]
MKSYAKINIFLKIIGTKGSYHKILSRFVLLENLYDEIEFVSGNGKILSNVKIPGKNIISKAKEILSECGFKSKIDDFFKTHDIKITKNIPMGGGLGGGSSNAATFLTFINKELNLGLSNENLMQIAPKIGSDVSFFVSGFKSANVSGIGQIVKEFSDDVPDLEIFTLNLHSDTTQIYKEFRENFMDKIDQNFAKDLLNLSSTEILQRYKNLELNDLLYPFLKLNPSFKLRDDEFLSGSGSSYFRRKI